MLRQPRWEEELPGQFFKLSAAKFNLLYDIEKATLVPDFGLMPGHVSCVPSAPGFPLSHYVPFTQMLPGHATVALALVRCQVIQGVSGGVTLITCVLNSHEPWLFSVILIDYKSNRELEK